MLVNARSEGTQRGPGEPLLSREVSWRQESWGLPLLVPTVCTLLMTPLLWSWAQMGTELLFMFKNKYTLLKVEGDPFRKKKEALAGGSLRVSWGKDMEVKGQGQS